VDRRAREIRLTDKGVKLVEETMIVVDQVRLEYAAKIGAPELDQLEDLLRRAVNKIELTYLPESWVEQKY
jgi:DNA-binding MarR family transcriptional regulator